MSKYDFASSGIKVNGDDSFHVVKLHDKDEWLLLRRRDGEFFQAATFSSPDEARAFTHSLGLDLQKQKTES